ncbi:Trihelix transcription factor GT-2 [Quillaja saponaria]|nr:Trihelix transcription factor GT-2 [Quillaja saponaria]
MKVMEKQEKMHKQLIEMIERKEKEIILREEDWKQRECERIKKEEEVREQEKSRNLALISFIQSLLGFEIQVSQPVGSPCMELNGCEADVPKNYMSDSCNNRWPVAEVQALITLRTALERKFRLNGSKGSIWEEISGAMNNMGYNRSSKKCKEKWENINKYYRRTMGSGKKRRLNSKACSYFNELDILYRNGLLNPGDAFSETDSVPKIEKE